MPLAPATPEVEDTLIPLSALQHQLFCPRQCALIHVEGLWAEDGATAEGRLLHERVDEGRPERRPGVRIVRGLAIRSLALGIVGKADVVEFVGKDNSRPFPVEYKRGKPKAHRADEVQLCAQAICLEEIFDGEVPEGALFYGMPRRRHLVVFTEELRALTADTAAAAKRMILAHRTPPPIRAPHCRRCSLETLCQPARLERPPVIARWLLAQIEG
jgi:CRISPR-associated exonuclease Cas4